MSPGFILHPLPRTLLLLLGFSTFCPLGLFVDSSSAWTFWVGHSVGKTARFLFVCLLFPRCFRSTFWLQFYLPQYMRKLWSSSEQESESCCRVWLCDPIHLVHGILQARILEWVAFPFSRGSSQPRNQNPGLPHCRQILYWLSHKGSTRILEWVVGSLSLLQVDLPDSGIEPESPALQVDSLPTELWGKLLKP